MIDSVKARVDRSSVPVKVRSPVTCRKGPVPARLVDVEVNAPVATSRVPVTWAVRVPPRPVNVIGPVNEATVPTDAGDREGGRGRADLDAVHRDGGGGPATSEVLADPGRVHGETADVARMVVSMRGRRGGRRERDGGGQTDDQRQDETA